MRYCWSTSDPVNYPEKPDDPPYFCYEYKVEVKAPGGFTVSVIADDVPCLRNDGAKSRHLDYCAECCGPEFVKFAPPTLCPDGASWTLASVETLPLNSAANPDREIAWTIECGREFVKELVPLPPYYHEAKIVAGTKAGKVKIRAADAAYPDCFTEGILEIGCQSCGGPSCSFGGAKVELAGDCVPCRPPKCNESELSCSPGGGVHVAFNLGNSSEGESLGSLYLNLGSAGPILGSATALRFHADHDEAEVIYDDDTEKNHIQQVKVPQGLAEVEVITTNEEYKIHFFANPPSGWTMDGDFYDTDGLDPFVTWKLESPTGHTTLEVSKFVAGTTPAVAVYEYTYLETTPGVAWAWSLTTGPSSSTTVRTESESWEASTTGGNQYWDRVYQVIQDGDTAYKVVETYQKISCCKRLISEVVDPDGAALTTTYAYYTSGTNLGRLWKQQNADGSWVAYLYDSSGRVTDEIRSWKNDALPSAPAFGDGRATKHTYSASTDVETETIEEYIGETLVGKTVREDTFADEEHTQIDQRVVKQYVDPGGSSYLETTTTYEGGDPHKIDEVTHPDGCVDDYSYATGDYDGSLSNPQFTAGGGTFERTSIVHQAAGTPSDIAGKTTRETTVRDAAGHVVLQETYVYDGSDYDARIGWVAREFDAQGRVTLEARSNGTRATTSYADCCGDYTTVAATGIEVAHDWNPLLGRAAGETKEGVSAPTTQPAITTSYGYVADNGVITKAVAVTYAGGGNEIATASEYDLAGRVLTTTDDADLVTEYAYDDSWTNGDGRKVTKTLPGGATEITEYYRDGRVKKVSGTGVVEQTYNYGVTSGLQWTQVTTGPASTSDRIVTTFYDALGRTDHEERPAFDSGTPVTTSYVYYGVSGVGAGQLKKVSPPGQRPTLYEYDALGNQTASGLDVSTTPDDDLDRGDADRIRETATDCQFIDSQWWRVTTESIYPTSGSGTALVVNKRRQRLTGYTYSGSGNVVDETKTFDVRNNATTTTTEYDRGAKEVTVTTAFDDATNDASQVSVNGLLLSAVSKSGVETEYGYDGFGRRVEVTDAFGTSVTNYDADTGQVASVVDTAENETFYAYYGPTEDHAGRLKSVTNPAGKHTYYSYTARGEAFRVWGDAPQPMELVYDDYGQRVELHTYRDGGLEWDGESWPSGAGDGDVTTWVYDGPTGLLTAKIYPQATGAAGGAEVAYDYTTQGRLETRTWARTFGSSQALTTTYGYDAKTGELLTMDYADSTPDVTFAYRRSGLLETVADGTGTRTFTYTDDLEPHQEQLPSFFGSKYVTHGYESTAAGRLNLLQAGISTDFDQDSQAAYAYNATTGRMAAVTGPGLSSNGVAYSYLADTDLVEKTEYKDGSGGGGAVIARAQRQFEADRALLDYVENKWLTGGTVTVSQYDYANNDLNLRTNVDYTGTAFAATQPSVAYDYNDRQELIEAQRTGDGANVWTYAYDPIGNRTASTLDDPSESADYESATNGLNQYANIRITLASTWTLQGYRYDLDGNLVEGFIAADMDCSGEVDFFDLDAFALALLDPEGYATEYPGCDPRNGDVNGDGELDFFDIDRFVEIALDGGSGLRFAYKWDAENRLIEAGPATTPVNDDLRVTFAYDYLGRRVEKKVEEYQSSSWSTTLHRKFVYDGWHLLLELDAANSNAIIRKYTWGLDLAGQNGSINDRASAGGIGGLLACHDPSASKNYYYFYDANGNVGQLLDAADGSLDAKYEYDPYGNVIIQSGSYANANPIRFGTKYLHDEIGWYDFGIRLYGPRWGRWANRDKLGEAATLNLFAAFRNNPLFYIDDLGGQDKPSIPRLPWYINGGWDIQQEPASDSRIGSQPYFNKFNYGPYVDALSMDGPITCEKGETYEPGACPPHYVPPNWPPATAAPGWLWGLRDQCSTKFQYGPDTSWHSTVLQQSEIPNAVSNNIDATISFVRKACSEICPGCPKERTTYFEHVIPDSVGQINSSGAAWWHIGEFYVRWNIRCSLVSKCGKCYGCCSITQQIWDSWHWSLPDLVHPGNCNALTPYNWYLSPSYLVLGVSSDCTKINKPAMISHRY